MASITRYILLIGALFFALSAQAAPGTIFHVKNVTAWAALASEAGENPLKVGLKAAEKKALKVLLRRMVASYDRDLHQESLELLEEDLKPLVRQSVIRGERRLGASIRITADVSFRPKAMREALNGYEIPFSEAPHPRFLLVVPERNPEGGWKMVGEGGIFRDALVEAALEFGIQPVLPLGDMDDMANLTGERLRVSDPELQAWVAERYGVERLLGAWRNTESFPQSDPFEPVQYRTTGYLLLEGESRIVSVSAGFMEPEDAERCLARRLAEAMVQSMADNWIQANALVPGAGGEILMTVRHDYRLPGYAAFLELLKRLPGVSGFRHRMLGAAEATLEVDFQGGDEALFAVIRRKGYVVANEAGRPTVAIP